MTLDKLLKENAAWLEQLTKQPVLGKIDAAALALPETQRQQRIADLKARIEALSFRRDKAIAAYDSAIAQEKAELDGISGVKPTPPPPLRAVMPKRATAKPKKKQ
jgi:hypothetical protein